MGKRRGRERLVTCEACRRQIPRDKAVVYYKRMKIGTDLGTKGEDVSTTIIREVYYCISCAKHRGIFEKKKKQAQRMREKKYEGLGEV